ncbi:hypothetical protein K437DRAFT_41529 [Tilletiaria anomala UBC 951]|uniref:Uncharacterized protein n=1 Tax=Tilletiaria anomala (strain ATCC 24038 / CBS 436.72 / UBC 951) TaxID=1037660 RepID=A0A066V687_TILAU|nr:uncharacterized protein K437DRAFT_41529 [Tilletiaria anomala UBC 951]KDN37262.1 hypothetical protein K437DRAFT_41529 [Tilletiaria anomala UBC 951]
MSRLRALPRRLLSELRYSSKASKWKGAQCWRVETRRSGLWGLPVCGMVPWSQPTTAGEMGCTVPPRLLVVVCFETMFFFVLQKWMAVKLRDVRRQLVSPGSRRPKAVSRPW